jgi:O-antigen ligase
LEAKQARMRNAAFLGTLVTAAVLPMSGSRSSVLLGAVVLVIAAWTSGLLFTRIGRRIMIGGALAAVLSVSLFPDAFMGVQSRFGNEEENYSRYLGSIEAYLPPLVMARVDAPPLGVGTGTQQNAHASLHVALDWNEESETGRYLVELGPVGLLVVWLAKLGLMIALFRAARILKSQGRRGAAAAAMSYAVLTFNGNLVFDHDWQALFFVGCGFILAEVVAATRPAVVPRAAPQAERSAAPVAAAAVSAASP